MRKRFQKIVLLLYLVLYLPGVLSADTKTVTDHLGRTVRIPVHAKRIISLAPSITEVIFALEQSHRLVGVTMFSDFPSEAQKLPKVGSYVHLNIEKIVALKPDLCIAVKDGNPIEVVSFLEKLDIPVYAVDPRDLEAVMTSIIEIGDVLDTSDNAKKLVDDMQARISQVKTAVSGSSTRPKVFFQIGIAPIVAIGNDTFIHELITMAGGYNLTAGPIAYPRYSREQVLRLAPEIFIITSMARGGAFEQVKAEWQRWPDMPAIKNNRIHLVNSDFFDRATPRLVDGLEVLAKIIHPELFGGVQ
ncbi:MAG: cobalamin-binding protein [Desulfobacterales bacterium]|nr:cobalamin-binding protein [Desulfobacterales bacterium]